MVVGVFEHAGECGLKAGEEPPLIFGAGVPGADHVVARRECCAGGADTEFDLAGQTIVAGAVPAFFEDGVVLVDVFLWRVVGRVLGAKAHVEEERLVRRDGLLGADDAHRLIDDVFGEVIAGAVRGIDMVVVTGEFGVPLVGFAFEETVEAIEAALEGPLFERAGGRRFVQRCEVPLADGEGVVAVGAEHFGEIASAAGDAAALARVAHVPIGEASHADGMVVAPGQQRGACWRAEGGGVEVGVAEASGGEAVDVWSGDFGAIAAEVGETHVVEDDEDDVGAAGRGLGWLRPPGAGFGVDTADRSLEDFVGHSRFPFTRWRRRGSPDGRWNFRRCWRCVRRHDSGNSRSRDRGRSRP